MNYAATFTEAALLLPARLACRRCRRQPQFVEHVSRALLLIFDLDLGF